MAAQIKITQLTDIGSANIATTTVLPVVNMAGVATTQKTTLGNLANVILSQSGSNYARAANANIAYSVANAAQPNITSVGTLTTLTVSGNTNLGAVGNVKITGGTAGQILSTDGAGNLSWVSDANGGSYGNSNVSTFLASYGSNTITTTGNVSVGNIIGNGQALTGIAGANVTGTVANANYALHVDVNPTTNNFSYHIVMVANPGDNALQVDDDDHLQYNPADGTLTTYRLDANILNITNEVASNMIPFSNVTYDLGNNTNRWKDIYLANSTIYLGDATLSANGNSIVVDSITVTNGNVGTIGNVASLNLDGNASNVLHGDGSWSADLTTYGNSNVATFLASYGSNTITTTGNVSVGNIIGNGQALTGIAGANVTGTVANATTAGKIANGTSNVNIPTSSGAVEVTAGTQHWAFGTDGTLTAPNDSQIVPAGNNFNIYTNDVSGAVQFFTDVTGNNHNWAFDGYGYTQLPFSQGYSNTAVITTVGAGNLMLQAGAGPTKDFLFGSDGNLTAPGAINVGNMVIGTVPGDITADANTGVTFNVSGPDGGFAVNYLDEVGNANTSGGELAFSSETGNATYRISLSDDLGDGFATKIWRFDGTGNLVLAGGNSVIYSIANSSLDPTNPNVSTMTLTPDANYNSQVLVLDPTAPGHIHLRAYASSNIDEPSANIFLGGENTSFEVTSGPNNEARIHSNNYTWTYGTDGNLTLPGSLLPTSDGNYDLGSNANRWRDLYLSGNTIYLGANATISAMDDDILIGTPNIDLTFGGGAFTIANISNANNAFSIALFDDGADILVNGNQGNLTFGGGAFVMAANASIGFADANGNILGNILLADDDILINTGPGGNLVFTGGAFVANTTDLRIGNTPTPVVVPVGVPIPVATKFSVVDGSFQQGNGDMWTDGFLYAANGIYTGANISANNIGNISGINLDGSNSNVLYGNGVFAPGGGGSYGDSNVVTLLGAFGSNTITTTGNVSVGNIAGSTNGYTLGYLDIPQVAASNTTLALGDAGKHYYSTTAGNLTLTIPNNATTSFATGTAISIVVQAAGNVLVNAAAGVTLYMAGSSSAGNRVVGTYGMATLMKVASDTWFINGTGVS